MRHLLSLSTCFLTRAHAPQAKLMLLGRRSAAHNPFGAAPRTFPHITTRPRTVTVTTSNTCASTGLPDPDPPARPTHPGLHPPQFDSRADPWGAAITPSTASQKRPAFPPFPTFGYRNVFPSTGGRPISCADSLAIPVHTSSRFYAWSSVPNSHRTTLSTSPVFPQSRHLATAAAAAVWGIFFTFWLG